MQVGVVRTLHRYPFKSMAGETLSEATVGVGGLPADRSLALRDEKAAEIRGGKHFPALMQCEARLCDDGRIEVTLPTGERLFGDDPQLSEQLSALLGRRVRVCPLEPKENLEHYRRRRPGSRLAGNLGRTKGLRRGMQKVLALSGQDADLRRMFGREPGESLPDLSDMPAEVFEFTSPPGTYFDVAPMHVLTTATLAEMQRRTPEADWDARRFRPNLVVETAAGLSGLVELGWAGKRMQIGEAVLRCSVPTPRCSMIMQAQPGLERDPKVLRSVVREADHVVGVYAYVERAGKVREGDPIELL